jgi:hypothetical protein
MRSTPGAPVERPPTMPSVRDSGVPSGRWNRCLAAVEGLHLLAVVVHQEGAAADARRLRLDQGQHQLGGDGGIDRAAALFQHRVAGLDGQRIGRRHHVLARGPAGLFVPAAGRLRGLLQGLDGILGDGGAGKGGQGGAEGNLRRGGKSGQLQLHRDSPVVKTHARP